MAIFKLTAHLRRTAECAHDGLWDRIGKLIDQVASAECASFFTAAGYEPD